MRKIIDLNDGWIFTKQNILPDTMPKSGELVSLPHSWNAVDGHDGHDIEKPAKDWSQGDLRGAPLEHYDRGAYWYCRSFYKPVQPLPGGRVYV